MIQVAHSQIDTIQVNLVGEFELSWTYSIYASWFDDDGDPYLYSACNELGIVSFDISDFENPVPVDTLLPAEFGALKPTNISHKGDYLYASLGGFQGFPQNGGLGIIDVSDPVNMEIVSWWTSDDLNQGAAIAITQGDYAFLGCMERGLTILDITDPGNPEFVSNLEPDPNFPDKPGLFSTPNARGMDIEGDILYLCYDHGGLRVIDISDKENPEEIAQYMNWDLYDQGAPAYNNVEIVSSTAYVGVDYCGMDVIDVSDPENPVSVSWLDPWSCSPLNWDGRPGHTNEVFADTTLNLLYMSGGDSEVLIYDISDAHNPHRVGEFIELEDLQVSWGINFGQGLIVTSMVDNPLGIPYDSDWGGIQIFSGDIPISVGELERDQLRLWPNPVAESLCLSEHVSDKAQIVSVLGEIQELQIAAGKRCVDVSHLSSGMYFIIIENAEPIRFLKL